MKQFRVHIYATVKVPVCTMAKNQKEAIKNIEKETNLHSLLNCKNYKFTEEVTGYVVDEFNKDGNRIPDKSKYYDVKDICPK